MNKIKILFYSHTIDYAGTWRSHERIIDNLDKDLFDPYVFYWAKCSFNNRLDKVEKIIGSNNLLPFERSTERPNPKNGYQPVFTNFEELAKKMNFDIIHFARSGYYEWPFTDRLAPLQIETNIFGHKDSTEYLDKSICITNYIANMRGSADAIIPNPIPEAIFDGNNLRRELNIPQDAIVFGKIGRPANFYSMALYAFDSLVKTYKNIFYIIIGPCQKVKDFLKRKKTPNIILFEPTNDDEFIEKFHRTIDAMLHYRSDGESHGTAIAQAMIYGKPVISHTSNQYNAQIETIGEGGAVAKNLKEYIHHTEQLIKNKPLRDKLSKTARKIALNTCEQNYIVKKIMGFYKQWHSY